MSKGPDHLAHQRLVALAQDRRRVAEKLPPLSGVARERLLAEVERMRVGSARLAEDTGKDTRVGSVWQTWLTWLGVAAAVGVLILVVRLSSVDPAPAVRPLTLAEAAKDEAQPTPSMAKEMETERGAPEVSPTSVPREGENLAALAAGPSFDRAGSAPAGEGQDARLFLRSAPADAAVIAGSASLVPTPATAGRSLLDAARRIRRTYAAAVPLGNPPPFLRAFEVSQTGSIIRLEEPDGSSYTGRISRLPRAQGQTGPMEWSFEGKGNRRSAAGTVWIVGNFVAEAPSSDASATPDVLEATLKVTVQLDGSDMFELRAVPSGP